MNERELKSNFAGKSGEFAAKTSRHGARKSFGFWKLFPVLAVKTQVTNGF